MSARAYGSIRERKSLYISGVHATVYHDDLFRKISFYVSVISLVFYIFQYAGLGC